MGGQPGGDPVVLAAARLRALHLDPLVTGSNVPSADHPAQEESGFALLPRPLSS
jgi:hypothetical protein